MFYYSVRDVGLIHELSSFIDSAKPTEQTKNSLLRQFPDFKESSIDIRSMPLRPSDESTELNLSFPHLVIAITGHAGSGKTHFLRHLANKRRTMFYAPTNAAGINLQNNLYPTMLFSNGKRKIYRTIHSFFSISPEDTNILGQQVMKVRNSQPNPSSYDEYCLLLYRACEPFCKILFEREQKAGKMPPETFIEHASELRHLDGFKEGEYQHEKVIEYLCSIGLRKQIPSILLYDICVLEEAGRTADYLGFLFLFYRYYINIIYQTYAWRELHPVLIFVGSVTQSKVIDDYTPYSALTFLGQPCVKKYIRESYGIKIKSFKDNRRVTTGNIDNNTTLSTCVNKLELGRSINNNLREKFNSAFVTDEKNFFDPLFKPSYFRIAKTHLHLKTFKANVFAMNEHNTVSINEYFLTTIDEPSFLKLEDHINVKFKSETYDGTWKNTMKKENMFETDYLVYKTTRKLLLGFRYLLTEYHKLYICNFMGTIDQFVELTDTLQYCIANDRSNCLSFFVKCAKYMIEDIYSNQVQDVVKSLNQDQNMEGSMQGLLAMKTLLRQSTFEDKIRHKVFEFENEQAGASIVLPKDIYSFVLSDMLIMKQRKENELQNVCLYLKLDDCLNLRMFPKTKSVSTHEATRAIRPSDNRPDFQRFKRKRGQLEGYADDYEVEDEQVDIIDETDHMGEQMEKLAQKSFFKFMPLVLHICSTIDATQGLTINSPILALITNKDKSEDIIVAFTRSSNPDTLMVANKVFDQNYSPISFEIKTLIKLINEEQKKGGWL